MSNSGNSRGIDKADREPTAKKPRKHTAADLGGPIDDEETARKKMEEAGFNPDEVTVPKYVYYPYGFNKIDDLSWFVNPMCHFAGRGDLKMCRYLVSKGASTTNKTEAEGDDISDELFPMVAAAKHGRKDVCEWLYKHGAHTDVSRALQPSISRSSPLQCALDPETSINGTISFVQTAQWLILHGAMPADGDGNLNEHTMNVMLGKTVFSRGRGDFVRERLLNWAENICFDRDRFFVFLCGTAHIPRFADGADARPIDCLSGHEGIRKRIGDFVGVMTGRNLKTVRQIVEPLNTASMSIWV